MVDSVQDIFRIGVSLICALYIEDEEWIGYKLYYRKIIYITSNNKNFKVYLQQMIHILLIIQDKSTKNLHLFYMNIYSI